MGTLASGAAKDALTVVTSSGAVRGKPDGNTLRWTGIPYAAAPIGELRFRAPQPLEPWTGVRDALEFGNAAPQEPTRVIPLPPGLHFAEDCLNLNVWAPASPSDTPRPVMVWIHGGAYFIGFSAQPVLDGRRLAETGDVIVVTLNYRLGALGFLDFSWLSSSERQFDSNLGLRDIIAALRWVQSNIVAFGGDPNDVTLFGESAGGGCITTLLTTPAADGLFQKAIAQSAPTTSVYGKARAESVARDYLELAGIPVQSAAEELTRRDATELASFTTKLLDRVATQSPGTVAFAPVVDYELIPDHPIKRVHAGLQHRIPLLIGTNRDEASLFKLMKSPLMPITEAAVRKMFDLLGATNPSLAENREGVMAAYPKFPRQQGAMEISRDAGFWMPSVWLAEAHSRVAPTWMYRFDFAPRLLKLLGIGASHGAELPYVFGTLAGPTTKRGFGFRLGGLRRARKVSTGLQAHWLAFARTGSPVETGAAAWPRYDEQSRKTLIIGASETVLSDPDAALRRAWGEQPLGFQ